MADTTIVPADSAALDRAAQILLAGGVIAFPTDTVYGLCADLFNAQAVQRIYEIKGRPAAMPLIAMFAEATQWSLVAAELPERARALIARWWPGPLTIIAPARAEVPALVRGGGTTIGMRIPDHPVSLALLRRVARPLATTSANRSGLPAACTAQEVAAQLTGLVDTYPRRRRMPAGRRIDRARLYYRSTGRAARRPADARGIGAVVTRRSLAGRRSNNDRRARHLRRSRGRSARSAVLPNRLPMLPA